MEMIKSCVSDHHIYHTKIFCSTSKWRWYGDAHESNKQKLQNKFKNKNKFKKHRIKNHTNIKIYFKKLVMWKHLLCNWWFQNMITWYDAWQKLSHIHKVLFDDAEYCTHEFYVSYTSIIKTMKMSSCQNNRNLYIKKSHANMTCITHQKLRYNSWFQKNECVKYLHDIFIKVPKSPTESTKNIKSRSQAVFGNTVLNQHQNHCDALIKLVNNYKKL